MQRREVISLLIIGVISFFLFSIFTIADKSNKDSTDNSDKNNLEDLSHTSQNIEDNKGNNDGKNKEKNPDNSNDEYNLEDKPQSQQEINANNFVPSLNENQPKPILRDFSKSDQTPQSIGYLVKTEYEIGERVTLILNPYFTIFNCLVDYGDSNIAEGKCKEVYQHQYSFAQDYIIIIKLKHGEIKREQKFGVTIKSAQKEDSIVSEKDMEDTSKNNENNQDKEKQNPSSNNNGVPNDDAKKNERKKGIFNWDSISIGELISMRVDEKDIAFRRVDFKSKSDLRGVVVKMSSLSPKPDTLPPASKKVYQYLEITLENIGDNDIESALISFSVPEKWHKENGISPESIILYRYSNNIWEKLKTKITGSEGSEVIYEAQSSGFSSFAVGSDELDTTPEQNVSSPQNNDQKGDEKEEDVTPKENSKESGNKKDKDKEDVKPESETKEIEDKEEDMQQTPSESQDKQDDLETLELEDGNIEEQEIKGKIMDGFYKEMRDDKKKSGKIGRKEDLEVIKIRKPDFIIGQEIREDTLYNIINEITIQRFIDEKVNFVASKIDIKDRQISEEQLNSEVEYLADVSVGEMPIIQDNVRDSIIKFRESKNNIELEKSVHYIDSQSNKNERLSVVKLKVKPKNTLRGFSIYEKIPKEVAENIDEIIFYDNNYVVLEPDPLIVWNFEEVSAPIEVSYGINKEVNTEEMSNTITLPISDKIVQLNLVEERKSPSSPNILLVLQLIGIPIFGIIIVSIYKFSGKSAKIESDNDENINEEIRRKELQLIGYVESELRHGVDMFQIRNELLSKHWPEKIIYGVFKILSQRDEKMLNHYVRKVSLEIKRLKMGGLGKQEIIDFLRTKKRYPLSLIENGLRYAS